MPRHLAVTGEGDRLACASYVGLVGIRAAHAAGGTLPKLGRLLLADKTSEDRDVLRFPPLSRATFSLKDLALVKEKGLRKKQCCFLFQKKRCG